LDSGSYPPLLLLSSSFSPPLSLSSTGEYYASIVAETRQAMRAAIPTASISVDVGWSPDNVDGRYYDIPALAAASDYLYVVVTLSFEADLALERDDGGARVVLPSMREHLPPYTVTSCCQPLLDYDVTHSPT
jgi:hypothetical protein